MPSKLITADAAARLVGSGATVAVCGISGGITPDKVMAALGRRYTQTGQPGDLKMVFPVAVGDGYDIPGMEHLAHDGMIQQVMGGSFTVARSSEPPPKIYDMIINNKIAAYNVPIGTLMQLLREIAAGRPGIITEVGLGTFLDPRIEGGRMNAATTEDYIQVITLNGKEYLFYPAFPIDVAIIRGTTADEDGYISMEHEFTFSSVLAMAMAAHNSGGKVIAQVKRIVARESIHPQMVRVPGVLVDAVVIDEEQQLTTGVAMDPAASGQTRAPWDSIQTPPLEGIRRAIVNRAVLELHPGDVINLGFGLTSSIPQVVLKEDVLNQVVFTTEHGCIGGYPYDGIQFGGAVNPQALIDGPSQFDFLDGGGPSLVCLSFAELDRDGNVNVTRLKQMPHVLAGAGGFSNIIQKAPRLVFCGTMTAGGVKYDIADGRITLLRAGKFKKVVSAVQQVTFNGPLAFKRGQTVLYITDLCVFDLTAQGLRLIEIAPGVDLQKDILAHIDFEIIQAPDLRTTDPAVYGDRLGLKTQPKWRR
jgi:propionate CoA-transferase